MVLAMLGSTAFAQAVQEQTIIKTAYAKLAYAVAINQAWTKITANADIDSAKLISQVDAEGLHFNLKDFKCGNLADVANAKYLDVFENQNRQSYVETSGSMISSSEVDGPTTRTNTAVAVWRNEPHGAPPDWTVKEMLPYLQQESGLTSPLSRYCTYTVTATLASRSETYRAYFLFTAEGEASPGDMGHGGTLLNFLKQPVSPELFLKGHLSKNPAASKFLESAAAQLGGQQ
jgi:hypothetical protein